MDNKLDKWTDICLVSVSVKPSVYSWYVLVNSKHSGLVGWLVLVSGKPLVSWLVNLVSSSCYSLSSSQRLFPNKKHSELVWYLVLVS